MTRFNPDLRPLIVVGAFFVPYVILRLTLWMWGVPITEDIDKVQAALFSGAFGSLSALLIGAGLYFDCGPIRLFREGDE